NYYNDSVDESGIWCLSTSQYRKELTPAIIEHFNQRLEKANLDRLTMIEENALCDYLNFPSVLVFTLYDLSPLSRIAEFHKKEDADNAHIIKSQLTKDSKTSKMRSVPKQFIDYFIKYFPKIMHGERTVWMRTFSSLAQNDRMMGRIPTSMDEELQKIIVSDVIEPAFERMKERSNAI
ncbi:MAG: hypothetical protein KAH86_06375, partial [Methanosarcinales archaeon]|nr:hypothetical protein [Methanosarcinales archaeon]